MQNANGKKKNDDYMDLTKKGTKYEQTKLKEWKKSGSSS